MAMAEWVPAMIHPAAFEALAADGKAVAMQIVMQPVANPPPDRGTGKYSEPRTLAMWADTFDMSAGTLSRWFRSGQVKAIRRGRLWSVDLRDIPGR